MIRRTRLVTLGLGPVALAALAGAACSSAGEGAAPVAEYDQTSRGCNIHFEAHPQLTVLEDATGSSPVVGDFDADGKDDVVVFRSSTLQTFRGTADGALDAVPRAPLGLPDGLRLLNGSPVGSLVAHDFDGDGHLDIVGMASLERIATRELWNGLVVFRGRGDGTFAPALVDPYRGFGRDAVTLAGGDVDGDGRADLLLRGATSVTVLFGTATGKLEVGPGLGVGPRPRESGGLIVTDMNQDGRADIVVEAVTGNGTVDAQVWVHEGGRTFRGERVTMAAQFQSWGTAVADLDGDARPDLVFRRSSLHRVLRADATGDAGAAGADAGGGAVAFGAPEALAVETDHISAVGDFDGDKRDDVLLSRPNGAIVACNLDGRPAAPATVAVPTAATRWSAVGDFDGDGRKDFATFTGFNSETMTVYRTRTGRVDTGDGGVEGGLDVAPGGDGGLDASLPPSAADASGDGAVGASVPDASASGGADDGPVVAAPPEQRPPPADAPPSARPGADDDTRDVPMGTDVRVQPALRSTTTQSEGGCAVTPANGGGAASSSSPLALLACAGFLFRRARRRDVAGARGR